MMRDRCSWLCLISSFGLGVWSVGMTTGAIAQEAATTQPEIREVRFPTTSLVIAGRGCDGLGAEPDEPVGELRQALLTTAQLSAKASDRVDQKVEALLALAENYACIGQGALAKAASDDVLAAADEMEIVSSQAYAIITLSRVYSNLGDTDGAKQLLARAVRLIQTVQEEPGQQLSLYTQLFFEYRKLGEYEAIREIIDSVDNSSTKELLIRTSVSPVYSLSSDEDKLKIREIFPELIIPEIELEASIAAGAGENSFILWLYGLTRQTAENFSSPNALTDFVSEQIPTIESFPDGYSRSIAYLMLWRHLTTYSQFPGTEQSGIFQVIERQSDELLERAVEAYKSAEPILGVTAQEQYQSSATVSSTLGVALISAGDSERGLLFLDEAIMLSENTPERILILMEAIGQLTEQGHPEVVTELLEKAEEIARSAQSTKEDSFSLLTDIAQTYAEIDNIEAARRITDNLLVAAEREPSLLSDEYQVFALISLMFQVDMRDRSIALVGSLDDVAKSELPGRLISIGEDQLAFQVLETIGSPTRRAYALLDMAAEYSFDEETETSESIYTLRTEALAIAQSEALAQDDYLHEAARLYGYPYSEAFVESIREEITYSIFSTVAEIEQTLSLLLLVENETLRNQLAISFLPSEALNFPIDESSIERYRETDRLHKAIRAAALEGDLLTAVEAIAQISSPYLQSLALIDLSQSFTDSATPISPEIAAQLTRIQQRDRQ